MKNLTLKKITLTFMFLLLVSGGNVFATPFLVESDDGSIVGDTIDIIYKGVERSYEVVNRHKNPDDWTHFFEGFEIGGFAASLDYDFTGYYIGTIKDDGGNGNGGANDGEDDMSALITYYLGLDYDYSVNIVKSDDDEPGVNIAPKINTDGSSDWHTGTWTLNGGDTTNFYAVKAANEYALYYINSAASSGEWTTAHLLKNDGIPEISHLSANIADAAAPIPEPATMFLFGVGLVGLAGFRRKLEK